MEISNKSAEEIDEEIEKGNARKVEAALFVAGRFLSVKELVALTDVNPILLRKILEDLADKYKGSGIEIISKNESWKMDVSADYMYMVNKLATGSSEFGRAEQETLAIIAYKQPIKQSVIVKIRGNKAYDHIRKFAELGLVTKKKAGRTSELSLSEEFYDYFNVMKGDELKGEEGMNENKEEESKEKTEEEGNEGEIGGKEREAVKEEIKAEETGNNAGAKAPANHPTSVGGEVK